MLFVFSYSILAHFYPFCNVFVIVYVPLGIAVWCAMSGASVVRVHDVKETVQALKVIAALKDE